jgi:nicotinamidase-related amidase
MRQAVSLGLLITFSLCTRAAYSRNVQTFEVSLRSRVQAFKNVDDWAQVAVRRSFVPRESAVLICDMWDRHWCSGATRRVGELASRMAPFLDAARAAGIQIIHAPSDTMDFYRDSPQRLAILKVPAAPPPSELAIADPPLPIDDSDGGCDTPGEKEHRVWTRENSALPVGQSDVISDNGKEIYSFLRQKGIQTIFVMGVHTNMCVLNRSFAIKQMTRWGLQCVLIRDLTDAMYNPAARPYVSHAQGTELVIEYIEKYWAPSVLSSDMRGALAAAK